MDNATYLAQLASAADRFTGQIEQSDLDAPVPTCPDWDVAALVDHLVYIHTWVRQILELGRDGAGFSEDEIDRPNRDSAAFAAWYKEAAAALHADLTTRDPDAPCWNFSGINETYGFWPRRQLHEVNVHVFDAALAVGTDIAIDPAAAVDGIDELFTVFGPRMAKRGVTPTLTAPITIALTDVDTSWTLLPPGEGGYATVTDDDRDAVARLAGTASDIYLALWNRLPADRLSITGDTDVAAAYLRSWRAP